LDCLYLKLGIEPKGINTFISTYNHLNLNAIVKIEPKLPIPPLLEEGVIFKLARG
jgi:hypothetical protein